MCSPPAALPTPRPARSALSVTTSDEPDIAAAATSGVARPATAIGHRDDVVERRRTRGSPASERAPCGRCAMLSATGVRLSPRKTMSAAAWARWVALIGEIETWAPAKRRRIVEAVADHQHLAALLRQAARAARSFSSGLQARHAPVMPSAAAMGATASSRSPERMRSSRPRSPQRLRWSAMASGAAADRPRRPRRPRHGARRSAKRWGAAPRPRRPRASASQKATLPSRISWPSTMQLSPWP